MNNMKDKIVNIDAMEILDSRGNPTVRVFVDLEDGTRSVASVPSGASTGTNEALELRDGDVKRFNGKGVIKAVDNIKNIIAKELIGKSASLQEQLDRIMINLDGTENKSKLGANAMLGVSMALAKSAASAHKIPLYKYLGGSNANRIPVPFMNIINGGEHSDNNVDFQEFMVAPIGAPKFSEGLRYIAEVFHVLKGVLKKDNLVTSVGDEGGFAPNLKSNEAAIEMILMAIEKAGYVPGKDIAIAIDSAASSFSPNMADKYDLKWSGGGEKTSNDLIAMVKDWVSKYPIILWEDPLSEGDWGGFKELTRELGHKLEIVGDDIFVTNTKYISRGINEKTANAALIKLNQIGTVSETIDAINLCKNNNWKFFLSHRSGETEDTFLADFAVAMGGGHLKTGSACRGERIAKYNRLLEIEHELGASAQYFW